MTNVKVETKVESGEVKLAKLPRAKLVERRDVTDDLMVIKLVPEGGVFDFKPGQYCTLGQEGVERAYSIVSAPYEDFLEVFVELVPEGELTPRMWRLKVGDTMSLRPRAKGVFTFKDNFQHHMMLSTVTGVAPTISMIRQYLHQNRQGHTFYVLLGASYQDELAYDRELSELADKYPNTVKFVPAVSRPDQERNAQWTGAKGRINQIFERYLSTLNLPKADTMIYACGHPGMIASAREKAALAGWNFVEERFWKD